MSVIRDGNVLDGEAVSERVRDDLRAAVDSLTDEATRPGLATVLMSTDAASETYVSMKQQACEDLGVRGVHRELDADAPAERLFETVESLNDDPDVHGILVQLPVPDHVDRRRVLRSIDPAKDVDGFHPANVGRLVAGNPRFKPCTPHGIQLLLDAADVDTEGAHAVVVGRSEIVGKPMANLLAQDAPGGNATTTVCHSRSEDLGAVTRQADVLVAAAGVPELVDGDMVREGAAVVDVGVNRVADGDGDTQLVGDVDFESVRERAGVVTPVPGGVGPMTITMLLYNTVKAASDQTGVDVDLPAVGPADG